MEDGFSLKDATIGILGLGLMGGSLALSLKGKCNRLIGFDSHPPTLELALSKGIIDHAESDSANRLAELNLLILAIPVPAILNFLKQQTITNYQSPITILDIGSTKRDITQAMSALPENFDPIGGHPICGKEKLGLQNADANLYQNAPFIVTPLERTTQRAKSAAKQIIAAIGANRIEMTAEDHDRTFAATSHLPFLLSSALTHATPQEFAPFIGPGFRSTSRLAGTPAHMMLGILKSNRDHVLNAMQAFRNSLDEIESALQTENYAALEALLNQARESHSVLTMDHGR
ncbi:MAG: prephenate dehydrogenase [Chloroflexi bacterium]|nr:prephenate dehydrogenase [Chloroflexota bacterium]